MTQMLHVQLIAYLLNYSCCIFVIGATNDDDMFTQISVASIITVVLGIGL